MQGGGRRFEPVMLHTKTLAPAGVFSYRGAGRRAVRVHESVGASLAAAVRGILDELGLSREQLDCSSSCSARASSSSCTAAAMRASGVSLDSLATGGKSAAVDVEDEDCLDVKSRNSLKPLEHFDVRWLVAKLSPLVRAVWCRQVAALVHRACPVPSQKRGFSVEIATNLPRLIRCGGRVGIAG